MKQSTIDARALSDADLSAQRQALAAQIPRLQQHYDALVREANRRKRAKLERKRDSR